MAAQAQSLRPSTQLRPLPGAALAMTSGQRPADYIVAIVNSEPVTNSEVRLRMVRIEQQLTQQGAALPPRDELARQVLERLIGEHAQLQVARDNGVKVDEAAIDAIAANPVLANIIFTGDEALAQKIQVRLNPYQKALIRPSLS